MQPPPQGLREFFQSLDMPPEVPRRRTPSELMESVRESNPVAFDAPSRLTGTARVTVVPGNHDHQLAAPGAAGVLSAAGFRANLELWCLREVGQRIVVLQHGHEWDEGNEQPGGSGEVLTNVLHHAVIPFLKFHGSPPNVRIDPDRVVALRPEEAVVTVLQRAMASCYGGREAKAGSVSSRAGRKRAPSAVALNAALQEPTPAVGAVAATEAR